MQKVAGVMEAFLKKEMATTRLVSLGSCSGGCINNAHSYETDTRRIFVKHNEDDKAKLMFEGECASLEEILATNTLRVPNPIKVVSHTTKGCGWVFIMEHIDGIKGLNQYQAALGEQLARLHLHNPSLGEKGDSKYVNKFGFRCLTCCGFIPMPNDWNDNWTDFYINNCLQPQFDLIEKDYSDREVRELWPSLKAKIPSFFEGLDIKPSLLHGDLWLGNVGETSDGPVTYDPASFYGHHEFDLAISTVFGGFNKHFYESYHNLIPKAPGFAARNRLYVLFNYVNHWNHFGSSYRSQSISVMKELTNW